MKMSHPVRGRRLVGYALLLLLIPLLLAWMQQGVVAVSVRYHTARTPGVVGVAYPYAEAVLDAMFRPFSGTSAGLIFVRGGGTTSYPPPATLYESFGTGASDLAEEIALAGASWCFAACVLLIMPVTFVLLPVTRRRAKVRWAHVWRVAGYSLIIPSLAACLFVLALTLAMIFPARLGDAAAHARWGVILVPIPALITWWAIAIRRYLMLPHGPAVALLLGVLSILLVPVVIGVAFGLLGD